MKSINISDEMYDFLMELSKEMNNQDNRCTAKPYFFQIQTMEKVYVPEDCGTIEWHGNDQTIETEEEIKEVIFEYKNWDVNNDEHNGKYEELDDIKEIILQEAGYSRAWYRYEEKYQNSFLTAKSCKEHIRRNHYHYNKPLDYLSHAFRNQELEKIMEFISGLTHNKLH